MAPLPEAALKEKAYRQLVSLAALERLEPGKHVAVPGRGGLIPQAVEQVARAWLENLDEARNHAIVQDGAKQYQVQNDLHRNRRPDEGARQDAGTVRQVQKERGWELEKMRKAHHQQQQQ